MKIKFLLTLLITGAALVANAQGYKDGIEYYKAGQYDNAKTILERTLNDASTDKALANYYLGQTSLALGDKAKAKQYFDNGIAADANNPYNYVGLGALDLLNGQVSTAEDNFKTADKLAKKNSEIFVAIGRAYYNADPVRYAAKIEAQLEKAHKKSKNAEPSIYILEGDMLLDQKQFGDAAAKYEMATTFDQGNPEGYVKYADAYFSVNPQFSVQKLEELLSLRPNSALAQRELAEKYYQNNQWTKAAEQYGKYIKNPNHFPEDKARYAVLLYAGQDYDESARVAEEVLATGASKFLMDRILFLNAAAKKEYAKARPLAEKFFNENKDGYFRPNDYITFAEVLENTDADSLAVLQYAKAVELEPNDSTLVRDLSAQYNKRKMFAQAAEAYQKYIDMLKNPSSNDLYTLSGRWFNAANAANATQNETARRTASANGIKAIDRLMAQADLIPDFLVRKARLYLMGNGAEPDQLTVDTYSQLLAELDKDPANKDPKNPDNYLDAYKEAYYYLYDFNRALKNDEEKTKYMELYKEADAIQKGVE